MPTQSTYLHLIDGEGNIAQPVNVARYLASSFGADPATLPAARSGASHVDPAAAQEQARLVPSIPELKRRGCDYRMVGVFGGQSSGKSTLLNFLFDTKFDTMDADRGRSQTTKGCFLSKARDASKQSSADADRNKLFVMDFEGTDGVERNENQNLEKQLALFALSVADTLIINMWANEVGRFNAANLSLLRTVFEVNLQLLDGAAEGGHADASSAARPMLLFVLRDFTKGTVEASSRVIQDSLGLIWQQIHKPARFKSAEITDLFQLQFVGLPHFELQRDLFDEAVDKLRGRFLNEKSADGFLYAGQPAGNFRNIPLDGVANYLQNCWTTIKFQKDLDIPSQREMLARLRCTELSEAMVEEVKAEMERKAQRIHVEGKLVPNITGWSNAVIADRLAAFEKETAHYSERVVADETKHLTRLLQQACDVAIDAQCKRISDGLVKTSESRIQQVLDMALTSVLPRVATEWFEKLQAARTQAAKTAAAAGESTEAAMAKVLDAQAAVKAGIAVNKFWDFISAELQNETDILASTLVQPSTTEGADGSSVYDDEEAAAAGSVAEAALEAGDLKGQLLACLRNDTETTNRCVGRVQLSMRDRISARLNTMTTDPQGAMQRVFERVLDRNDDGTTRFTTTVTGLDKLYGPARATGLMLLASISVNRVSNALGLEDITNPTQRAMQSKLLEQWLRNALHVGFTPIDDPKILVGKPTVGHAPTIPKSDSDEQQSSIDAARNAFQGQVLLDEVAVVKAYEMYTQQCEFTYKMRMQQILNGQQSIPVWMYGLVLVLGADEFYWLITNPLLLLMVCLVGWFFFRQWIEAQWQKFEETGPPGVVLPLKAGMSIVGQQYNVHVAPLLGGARGAPAAATGQPAKRKAE